MNYYYYSAVTWSGFGTQCSVYLRQVSFPCQVIFSGLGILCSEHKKSLMWWDEGQEKNGKTHADQRIAFGRNSWGGSLTSGIFASTLC